MDVTKEQLKTLSTLPKVLSALRALVAEGEELATLLARVGGPQSLTVRGAAPTTEIRPPPVMGGPIILDTPERREYEAALRPKKRLDQLPAAQRRAIEQGFLSSMAGERAAKLEQFKHDGPPEKEEAGHVDTEEINTMSGDA